MLNYSVLMSVYYKEKPEYLQSAMESIWNQTKKTNDFVLVCDGSLTPSLNQVIEDMHQQMGDVLQVIRLEKNVGLGKALNEGMRYCKNEIIARMDSDDISYPNRCEQQMRIFLEKQDISICSGIVEEFDQNPDTVTSRRVLPETSEEIVEFAKERNPFNHPCVMYKKSMVLKAGGYQDFYLLEDYYLWIRMLMQGAKGWNLQVPLLHMRAGNNMYKRRSGWKYAQTQIKLFQYMRKQGFISNLSCIKSIILRSGSSLVPNWLRKFMFRIFLRQ